MSSSELLRHLQTLTDRKPNIPGFRTSVTDSSLRGSSFPYTYPNRDTNVDSFKGKLLGVEDELIDALVNVACSSRPALISSTERNGDVPADSQSSGWADSRNSYRRRGLGCQERHSNMRSNTTSHDIPNPWAVGTQDDSSGSGYKDGKCGMFEGEMGVATARIDVEHLGTNENTRIMPLPHVLPSPGGSSDPCKARATSIAPDDYVLDSIVLEKPGIICMLWTCNLNDWQTTMNCLLVAGSEGNDERESIALRRKFYL